MKLLNRCTGIAALLVTIALAITLTACGGASSGLDLSPTTAVDTGSGLGDFVQYGLIINAANLKDVFRGYQNRFNNAFRDTESMADKVATMVPSTTAEERYGWLGQFPQMREWLGDRQIKNLEAHDYTIRNKPFESTVGVPRPSIEDDQFGVYSPLFDEMGYAAKVHPDELVFPLLSDGFSSTGYDGQYFFDTDHPVGDGTVSNMQSGSSNPWFLLDTTRPIKPLIFQKRREYNLQAMQDLTDENVFMRDEYLYGVDARVNAGYGLWQLAFGSKDTLSTTNFDAAVAAMMAFKSDEGRPLGVRPSVLVVGPSNRAAANEAVKVERLANGASNPNFQVVDVMVVPWLD